MIDLNSKHGLSDRVNWFIDRAIDTHGEKQRGYLGASSVGHECERKVQYDLLASMGDVEKKQPTARIRRIFDRGNVYEEKARRWLKDAGFVFGWRKDVFPPNSFSDFDGVFKGHADGVITGWRNRQEACPIELPVLWECKCLGAKGFNAIERDGLKKYSPTYWAQVHIYMNYLMLDRCLYTVVNADTMEMLHLRIDYDIYVAQDSIARVKRVINATKLGELVPRCTADPNYYICKSLCDYREECWQPKGEKP